MAAGADRFPLKAWALPGQEGVSREDTLSVPSWAPPASPLLPSSWDTLPLMSSPLVQGVRWRTPTEEGRTDDRRGRRAPRQQREETFLWLLQIAGLVLGWPLLHRKAKMGPWKADGAGGGGVAVCQMETGV